MSRSLRVGPYPENGWEKRAPKNVAAKSGYYALPGNQGDAREDVERLFALAESQAATIIRTKVLREQSLATRDVLELAGFIGLLHVRVPRQIEHIGEYMAEVPRRMLATMHEVFSKDPQELERYKERYRQKTGRGDLDEATPEWFNPDHYKVTTEHFAAMAMTLQGASVVGRFIAEMGWTFLVSRSAGHFITSDYQVNIVDPVANIHNAGLAFKNVEVTFSVSRDIALVMAWENAGFVRWRLATADDVAEANTRTAIRAYRLIAPKPAFPGADLILAKKVASPPPTEPQVVRLTKETGYLIALTAPPLALEGITLRPLIVRRDRGSRGVG